MALFYATDKNVHLLKTLLMHDYGMSSSHASEAIAALAGFSTHSAFKTSARSQIYPLASEANFTSFVQRASKMGCNQDDSEHLSVDFAYLDWPDRLWRALPKTNKNAAEHWFNDSKKQNIPYLLIEQSRKYCTFSWDHITMDSSYDERLLSSYGHELGKRFFRFYQLVSGPMDKKSFFSGSGMVGDITGLSASTARQIANEFAKVLCPGNLDRGIS